MRHLLCLSLVTTITIVLPNSDAAPAPKRTYAKPAVIDAGNEKNVAAVLGNLAAGSGVLLRAVCWDKNVTQLEIVSKQKNPRAWLGENLQVKQVEGKNLIRISLRVGTPKEQAIIINAVVKYYLEDVAKRRESLTASVEQGRKNVRNVFRTGRMSQKQLEKEEESLKETEEYIRSLPTLLEAAKAP